MERSRIQIDQAVRANTRARWAALAADESARDRRGLALRDMALRPFRRALRGLWIVATPHLDARAADRAAS
jgi:hypothetical protein